MNSIFIYLVANALRGAWLDRAVGVFTERSRFLGMTGAVAQAWAAFFVMWYLCYWLYKHQVFFEV
jgi:hypothetical protein